MAGDGRMERTLGQEMALLFGSGGSPPMAGRVWAGLLVAAEPYLSAAELAEKLEVSAGSISMATRFLIRLGLIERIRLPGERRDHFAARPGAIADLVRWRLERLSATEDVAARALTEFGDRPLARERLTEIHDVYAWYARELPALHERFLAEFALGRPQSRGSPA